MTAEQFRQKVKDAISIYENYARNMRAKEILCVAQWADEQANNLTDMMNRRRPFPEQFSHFAN